LRVSERLRLFADRIALKDAEVIDEKFQPDRVVRGL
jgi:hypothetical protein